MSARVSAFMTGENFRRQLIISLITLSVSSCNLEWDKPEVSAPPPAQFKQASPRSAHSIDRGAQFVSKFNSKELTELSVQLLSDNLDLAAASARIIQADANARVLSAPLWPNISLGGLASTNHFSGAQAITNALANQQAREAGTMPGRSTGFFELGVASASYTVDFWGKNEDASFGARILANASRFDRDTVEISQITTLMDTYFQLLAAQDQLSIAITNANLFQKIYETMKLRFTVGSASAFDLSQQGATLEAEKATIPVFQQKVLSLKTLLCILIGRTPESIEIKGGSLDSLKFPNIDPGLPSEVLLRRPDIAQNEAQLASQEFSVLNARAQFFPSITLRGFYGPRSGLIANLFRPEALAWDAATQLAQPLFDGFYLLGQYEKQKGRYAELVALYRKSIISALQDVEIALINTKQFKNAVTQQIKAVNESKEAFRLEKLKFDEGSIDVIALTIVQRTMFDNQEQLVTLKLRYYQAASQLYQALGGGWEPTTRNAEIADANARYQENLGPWP